MPQISKILPGLCLFVIMVNIWILGEVIHQSKNVLHHYPHIQSSKLRMEKGLTSAAAFVSTQISLAQQKLNLGAWHGFQEVVFTPSFDLKVSSIDLDLQFTPPCGIFYLYLIDQTGTRMGLRLSHHRDFVPIFFTMDKEGQFLEKKELSFFMAWEMAFHLRLVGSGGKMQLFLNGKEWGSWDKRPTGKVQLALASYGNFYLTVDNILVQDENHRPLIDEAFDLKSVRKKSFLQAALFFLALNLLYVGLVWKKKSRHKILYNLYLNFLFFLSLAFYCYWTNQHLLLYPQEVAYYPGYPNRIEDPPTYRQRMKKEVEELERGERSKPLVLLFGGSQLWGAGAESNDKTSFSQLQKTLAKNPRTQCYQFFNAAMNGANSGQIVANYQELFETLGARYVILNLGRNDMDNALFYEQIDAFMKKLKDYNIQVILITEPLFVANMFGPILSHLALKKLAQVHQVPFLDFHQLFTQDLSDLGPIWWDMVHLNNFGQKLYAQSFAQKVAPLLSSCPP